MSEHLFAWEIDRLAELRREWRASRIEYERTVVEGVPALRVTVYAPDPKQEDAAALRFLATRGATIHLPLTTPKEPA